MSHSLNEIEALAKRAARGAGLSWGIAEEAGKATRWLAAHDLAGPELLVEVLTQNDGKPRVDLAPTDLTGDWHAPLNDLCPLAAGASLNDCADRLADSQSITMINLSAPLLLVPFAAWAAIHNQHPVHVAWADVQIDTDGYRMWGVNLQSQINTKKTARLTCQQGDVRQDAPRHPGKRGTLSGETLARLDHFARRTYAPATEDSRLRGAGAGVSDND